ncbi:cytochrome c [Pseudomonas sp. SJZ079]|jgi:cytochrome c|uniref:cache domain-containing protein n=1 Tax=Pseudomonas sp. SJZ079 TaxID=2572887 RepID=UPI001199FAB5|nr:cache domain-containing protein [Pseudomonas sp. SJZ079]TWC40217.1 cytochrome c [Pseudomonas sp. SJZ079]
MSLIFRNALLLLLGLFSLPQAFAQDAPAERYTAEAERANRLLSKAVAFYQEKGDAALAVFSRQGEFIDGELYVYVLDTAGVMLASGGPSVNLVGRNISSALNKELNAAFQEALSLPDSGAVHRAEYRWLNWNDGKVERKHVFFRRVGERIFAVGYYMPRATPEEAVVLLERAAAAVAANPKETFTRINSLDADFIRDDLYVFVADLRTERYVAHGYNLRLVGTDFRAVQSVDHAPIGEQMLEIVNGKGEGDLTYLWRNPVTGRSETKHTLIRKVGDYAIAVGYYQKPL